MGLASDGARALSAKSSGKLNRRSSFFWRPLGLHSSGRALMIAGCLPGSARRPHAKCPRAPPLSAPQPPCPIRHRGSVQSGL